MKLLALSLLIAGQAQDDGPRPWGPEQAVGAPDTTEAGDQPTAWASRSQDGGDEWLTVRFAHPARPSAARVFESFNPGALVAVLGVDADGGEHELWRGADPTPVTAETGVSLVPFVEAREVVALKLLLDSDAVRGWNEIDAVGWHDEHGRLSWAVAAEASSTYARGAAAAQPVALPQDPLPRADWEPRWRTPADGLLALFAEERARGGALARRLATEIVAVQRATHPGAKGPRTFEGLWDSSFGPLRLTLEGENVSGLYSTSGGTIEGTLAGARLEFTYHEKEVSGEGWFELAEDGGSFEGEWRPEGTSRWRAWRGTRRPKPRTERKWLVVLEAPWEASLSEPEYSFGGMLRAIFGHKPGIEVRQRFFADQEAFETWCRELAFLDEPVYLMIASHATRHGVQCHGGTIGPAAVAQALRHAHTLRLVHFSACEAMRGSIPDEVLAACAAHPEFAGVSGYDVSVDWMGSALTEFTYMDLLLNRGLEPARAAEELVRVLDFADDEVYAGSPVPASHFRFRPRVAQEADGAE